MDRQALIHNLVRTHRKYMGDHIFPLRECSVHAFLSEYGVLRIGLGRGFGYTRYIQENATPLDFVIGATEYLARGAAAPGHALFSGAAYIDQRTRGLSHAFQRIFLDSIPHRFPSPSRSALGSRVLRTTLHCASNHCV